MSNIKEENVWKFDVGVGSFGPHIPHIPALRNLLKGLNQDGLMNSCCSRAQLPPEIGASYGAMGASTATYLRAAGNPDARALGF